MKISDFDFHVPEDLVAQHPLEQRDAARMLVFHRKTGLVEHRTFKDFPEYLGPEDILVFNRSKVLKARLVGKRSSGGRVEVFLLRKLSSSRYECLVKATAARKEGLEVEFGDFFKGRILSETATPMVFEVELEAPDGDPDSWIDRLGRVPLPPYIKREAEGTDASRYQTVFAQELGSVAAPTAGLHFTKDVLERIRGKGAAVREVLLHVGLGTFQPIKVDDVLDHRMHQERFSVSESLKSECRSARRDGKRVIAVGTTSVRALESAARGFGQETDLFLHPGKEFLWVDALFTNFHQPKSSLTVMLSAFLGSAEALREIYAKAVEERYRFFSYGDCMLVL